MRLSIGAILGLLPGRTGRAQQGLASPAEFRHVVENERSLVDRNSHQFSLLTFSFEPGNAMRAQTDFVHLLRRRLRATDTLGWFDRRTLGALLPFTSRIGAQQVIADLKSKAPAQLVVPLVTILTYPDEIDAHGGSTNGRADNRMTSREPIHARTTDVPALDEILATRIALSKRGVDVCLGLVLFVLALPLMVLIALAIRLSSRGPAVYRQLRAGRGGRPFILYKFRTMIDGAEAMKADLLDKNEQDGPAFKMRDDPRVTPVGRILRRTSLDELPQLWNVLRGDMSLVGPRPLPVDEDRICRGWRRRRLDVTPGITGVWQVRGRCRINFDEWMRMDVRYARTCSLGQDFKLLLLTIPAVLGGEGAH